MSNACKVEKIIFRGEEDPCCTSIPEQLMSVNGLALVGTGSLSCIRALYDASVRCGRQHQFFHCGITREEYAAGTYGPKLLAAINRALACRNTRCVVIYASCLEILAQMNFEELFSQADNPKHIPIHLLKRGPLVGRYGNLRGTVAEILKTMAPAEAPIRQEQLTLPPLYPDYTGIGSVLQNWDTHNFLVTAGGCGGALMDTGTPREPYRMSHSRLNDVQISLGCDGLLEQGIRNDRMDSGRPLSCILGSTTLGFTGVDCDGIAERMREDGLDAVYFPCSGFAAGPAGGSAGLLQLAQKLLRPSEPDPGRVNILGYSPMVFGSGSWFDAGVEYLAQAGMQCRIWGTGGMAYTMAASGAALNWVVSAEGLETAEYMKQKYGIPFCTGIPMGRRALARWAVDAGLTISGCPDRPEPAEHGIGLELPAIAVIGEPILADSIRRQLRDMHFRGKISVLVYTPDRKLQQLYAKVLTGLPYQIFRDAGELHSLTEGFDILIADPVYGEYLPEKRIIPLSYPLIGGRRSLPVPCLFGEAGEKWLTDALNMYLAAACR